MDYLRHSGKSHEDQCAVLEDILRGDSLVWPLLERARDLALPDWMVVSGAIYNTVWNQLTGKPSGHGIKDVDLFYFDPNTSFDAEDVIIRRGSAHFAGSPLPVEIRNQARVHLWYADRFEGQCPQYNSSAHALEFFASQTHSVGVRLDAFDRMTVAAPFGLDDIFSFRMMPNRIMDNRATHEEKAARAKRNWPEIMIEHW